MSWSATLFATALGALSKKSAGSGSSFGMVTRSILRYPIKMLAAFVMAPFLAFRVAFSADDPLRRTIARVGLVLAVVAAWFAGGILGTFLGYSLIYSFFGFTGVIAALFGLAFGAPVSVAFSILALNATSWFFLHMSSEEVVEYLRSVSS